MNKFFSSSPVFYNSGIAIIRIITGIFMIYHGWEIFIPAKMNEYLQREMFKNSSIGELLVYTGKAIELIGGILLFLGLFTRIGSVLVIGSLGYIAFFVGNGIIWYDDQHPFLFVLLGLLFFFTGPGKYSLDHILFNRKPV